MVSNIARKMLKFMLVFLCFVPWISQLYMPYMGITLFLTLILVWLMMVFVALIIPYLLKKVTKVSRIMLMMGGLAIAVFIPLLYYRQIRIIFLLPIILGIISLAIWISAIGLSVSYDNDAEPQFKHITGLFIGLLPFVFQAIFYPQFSQITYICFFGYLILSALWMFQWNAPNFLTSLSVTGAVIVGLLFLGGMKETILAMFGWVYRVIIVNVLLGVLSFFASIFLRNPIQFTGVSKFEDYALAMKNLDENAKLGYSTPQGTMMTFSKILFYLVWILVVILLIYLLYRMINYIQKKDKKQNEREIVESINEEYHLAEHLWTKTKGILKRLRLENLSTSREERVRWMYRKIIQRMMQCTIYVSKTKTPIEVMKDFFESKELITAYNRVRYGEENISSDEFEKVEKEFKQIMERLKLIWAGKKVNG